MIFFSPKCLDTPPPHPHKYIYRNIYIYIQIYIYKYNIYMYYRRTLQKNVSVPLYRILCSTDTHFYDSSTNIVIISFSSSSGMYQSHHPFGYHATGIISSLMVFLSSSCFSNLICLTKNAVLIRLKIKARKRNLVNFKSSDFMIFTLNPVHRMPQKFLTQQNIFIFVMNYCRSNIFIDSFYSLCALLPSTKYEYIFGFILTKLLNTGPAVSSFILPITNLFKLS